MEPITLAFTPQGLALLSEALARLPYGQVVELIRDINAQIQAQSQAPTAPSAQPSDLA